MSDSEECQETSGTLDEDKKYFIITLAGLPKSTPVEVNYPQNRTQKLKVHVGGTLRYKETLHGEIDAGKSKHDVATQEDLDENYLLLSLHVGNIDPETDVDITYPATRKDPLRVRLDGKLCFNERLPGDVDSKDSTYLMVRGKKGFIINIKLKKVKPGWWEEAILNGNYDSSNSD